MGIAPLEPIAAERLTHHRASHLLNLLNATRRSWTRVTEWSTEAFPTQPSICVHARSADFHDRAPGYTICRRDSPRISVVPANNLDT